MGTIIPFVPLAKSWVKYLPKIADRPYSKVEAALCVAVDYDEQNTVTVRGYAKLWKWNKKTVAKFLNDHGAEIVYPKNTSDYKNQRGSIGILKRDQKVTNKQTIGFIDNKDLTKNRDQKVTNEGPKSNQSLPPTKEPKPEPKKYTDAFERWWKISPKRNGRRVGKEDAFKEFQKIPESEWKLLKTATDNYNLECGDYAKDPARFLKKDFWKDYTGNKASSTKTHHMSV